MTTPIRPRRYRGVIHALGIAGKTMCNRPCEGWLVSLDTAVTCARCREASEFN
jgi:hypothetical protein